MMWWSVGGGTVAVFVLQFPLNALLGYNVATVLIEIVLGMLTMLLIAYAMDVRKKGDRDAR